MRRVMCVLAAAALMVGCSTTPISAEIAKPVPVERLFLYQQSAAGAAELVVTRDRGFTGSACKTKFFVDGRLAGEIGAGEVARFWLPPGATILGAGSGGVCPSTIKEREVSLAAGKVTRYRISIDSAMSMDLSPTAF